MVDIAFIMADLVPSGIQSFSGWKLISLVNISACVTVGGLGSC